MRLAISLILLCPAAWAHDRWELSFLFGAVHAPAVVVAAAPALDRKGRKKWNKLLAEAIDDLRRTFNYDRLYIGGGNTKFITLKLPPDAHIVSNEAGMLGGIALWKEAPQPGASPAEAAPAVKAAAAPPPGSKVKGKKKAPARTALTAENGSDAIARE